MFIICSFLLKKPRGEGGSDPGVWRDGLGDPRQRVPSPSPSLFYFHSFICMAEIMHRSYTRKYIGLVRMSKQRRYSRAANRKNANNLIKAQAQPNNQ